MHFTHYLPVEKCLPRPPQSCLCIDRVPTPGQDPRPVLTGYAAQRDTSPASSPRRLLCPRAERSKFASLCSPRGNASFRQWHTASKARCQARQERDPSFSRQGRAGGAEGSTFPIASISPHLPSPAEITGRAAAPFGVLHLAQRSLPSSGMGDGEPVTPNGWGDPAASLCCGASQIPLPAFFPLLSSEQKANSRRAVSEQRGCAPPSPSQPPVKGRSVLRRPASAPTAASLFEGCGQTEIKING